MQVVSGVLRPAAHLLSPHSAFLGPLMEDGLLPRMQPYARADQDGQEVQVCLMARVQQPQHRSIGVWGVEDVGRDSDAMVLMSCGSALRASRRFASVHL